MPDIQHYLDLHISQLSVAICLKYGRIFNDSSITNFCQGHQSMNFKNLTTSGDITDKSLVYCFFNDSIQPNSAY